VLALSYAMLFLLCFFVKKMKSENLTSEKVQAGRWILLHIRHAGGLIFMIVLPVFFLPSMPKDLLEWPQHIDHVQVMALMITGLAVLLLAAKEADKSGNKIIVANSGSSAHALLHMLLRNSFLISYEWFFRGVVLFSCVSLYGLVPAVIINIVLYALIHSISGRKEFFGSILLGIILCVFTLWWQSAWPAILLHLLLSATYESVLLHQFFCKPSKINL
jgi:membrane protease YdiL (CAAX protease family)